MIAAGIAAIALFLPLAAAAQGETAPQTSQKAPGMICKATGDGLKSYGTLTAAMIAGSDAPARSLPLRFSVGAGALPLPICSAALHPVKLRQGQRVDTDSGHWSVVPVPGQCMSEPASRSVRGVESPSLPLIVAPRQRCAFEVHGPQGERPAGQYTVKVELRGTADEPVLLTLALDHARSPGALALMLLVGAGGGLLVGGWRDSGARARSLDLLSVRQAMHDLEKMLPGQALLVAAALLINQGRELAGRIQRGDDYAAPEVAELRRRVARVPFFLSLRRTTNADAMLEAALKGLGEEPLAKALDDSRLAGLALAIETANANGIESSLAPSYFQLPLPADASPDALRDFIQTRDSGVTAVLILLFLVVAHAALWSPTWGRWEDHVAAIVTGFGAWAATRAGIAATIDAARGAAK